MGKWQTARGDSVQFYKDGTFSAHDADPVISSDLTGNWEHIEAGAIKVTVNAGILGQRSTVVHWKIDGDKLSWTEDSEAAKTYTKAN